MTVIRPPGPHRDGENMLPLTNAYRPSEPARAHSYRDTREGFGVHGNSDDTARFGELFGTTLNTAATPAGLS
ncbi:hypothetical protein FFI94_032325 [Rhodococcus sp. KBS0724]|uniref:hypothetical protein n=1 Tax=Rhodococcus sp. KBS0724 TaxID=1179674 RepID=UPI00110E8B41|nr:hypothetical protein [Rhodococcus sp. KBS0724]TSD40399.1 hypothetical protein FFI94_032325 [Rhodococcus sp. KBS0724]